MKYNIKMLDVRPEILDHGFVDAGDNWGGGEDKWYKTIIPQTFRGTYTLYLCKGDICGTFQGMAIQDHDFDSLMDKLSFRTPEAVLWTRNMLNELKDGGIINFEELIWEE